MEDKVLKLMAQIGLIGVAIYAIQAARGKGGQMYVKKHASVRKQDPTSLVWSNTSVQGPNATTNKGQLVSGYVGVQ